MGIAVLREGRRRAPAGLADSKVLSEERREQLFEPLASWCDAWAVGHAGPEECDEHGMTQALRLALRRAVAELPDALRPDAVVLDGPFDYVAPPSTPSLFDVASGDEAGVDHWEPVVRTVVRGDSQCVSVAAASVLAKVTRDRIMRADAASYPPFDFERNKGYPSPAHRRALRGYGLSALHRRSWSFVDGLPWR